MVKSSHHDPLSPNSSPSVVSKSSGVRRVNNVPLYLIYSIIIAFVLMVGWVGIDRSHQSAAAVVPNAIAHGDTLQLATTITGNRIDGFIPAADAPTPVPLADTLTVPIAVADDPDAPPLPPRLKAASKPDPDAARIEQEKKQLFETGVRSKTSVAFTAPQPTASNSISQNDVHPAEAALQNVTPVSSDVNTRFKARLAELQAKGSGELLSSQRNDLSKFDATGKADRWQLDSHVEAPKTPYTLRAGFVIPASLISGINSELPGQIIGQISQNVYDTASGRYLLVPQGSRLVGTYTSDVAYGQSRVMVAWQRIIFPDGKALDIGAMPGADGDGYSGFNDQVNNHYLRIFGSAILMSGITAGASLSQNGTTNINGQESASAAMSAALGQQLGTVTSQMISKNLNISPTLEIRPGFRFNVMCVKDLVFDKPYESFDYSGSN